jgi:serine/threonine-protein kinase RsbW
MVDEPDCVRLEIPLDTRYVRIVRLVARGVGAAMGFDVEDVDDLRIAVEEMCAALFDVSQGSAMELSFEIHQDRVDVQGRAASMPTATLDAERFALSEQILRVACDGYRLNVDDGTARFSLHKLA